MSAAPDAAFGDMLRRFAASATGLDVRALPVAKLKGDASNRSYFRLGTSPSFIAMVMPPGPALGIPGAPMLANPPDGELSFVNVHRYLATLQVRVPQILRHDPKAGLMLLEDLGDVTLEQAVRKAPADRQALYERAIDLLAGMRARSERSPDLFCVAFARAFDEALLGWELQHFREWGLEARSGRTLPVDERSRLDGQLQAVARELAAEPRGLTHRDFQSRNLMLVNGALAVIDFQDALLGPRQYDLVALLRDSYVPLERSLVEHLLDRYRDTYARLGGEWLERTRFMEVFDLITVQRKLKDAGRFVYLDRVRKNPSYLPFVPTSLAYVREALERIPRLAELRALLGRHVPELRP